MSENTQKPELLVYGDSHTRYILGGTVSPGKQLIVDHGTFIARGNQLGDTGATIWGLNNKNSTTGAGEKIKAALENKTEVNLYLSLGEVDVRNHIHKHSPSVLYNTKKLIDRYGLWLDENVIPHLGNSGQLFLTGCVPYTQRLALNINNQFLHLAYAPSIFNALIYELCHQFENTHYIDLFEGMIAKDGYLPIELSSQPTEIIEAHLDYQKAEQHVVPQIEKYLVNEQQSLSGNSAINIST